MIWRNQQQTHGCQTAEDKAWATIHLQRAEDLRYNERSAVERVNARLKDEFGGRFIRVRGHAKVMCHLMFGVLALTADPFILYCLCGTIFPGVLQEALMGQFFE